MPEPLNIGRGRAQLLIIFLILGIVADAFDLILSFIRIVILPGSLTADLTSLGETTWYDILKGVIGLLQFVVYITTAVLFLIWLYRASKNLRPLGASQIEFTPGWAVGWFFIPLANLVNPYRVVKEIWVKSEPKIAGAGESYWQQSGSTTLLGWWWAAWLLTCFANQAVLRLSTTAETPDADLTLLKVEIIADAFGMAAGWLAFLVVRGISNRQEERSKHYQTNALPPPPPVFAPPTEAQ
jgi:Domain of unknown function (DUF4328)